MRRSCKQSCPTTDTKFCSLHAFARGSLSHGFTAKFTTNTSSAPESMLKPCLTESELCSLSLLDELMFNS